MTTPAATTPTDEGLPPLGRRFWTLAVSSGASNLADGVAKLALPLVAVTLTRSPGLVAGLEVVRSLPWLILALHAGAIVDRSDRRRTMLVANAVRAVVVLGLTVGLTTGAGKMWWLYVAAIGTGIAEVFHDTAAQTILPAVVERRQLSRANGRLYGIEFGAQQFLGPPLAGALVAVGAALAFGLSAGMWLAAVALLVTVRGSFSPRAVPSRDTAPAQSGTGIQDALPPAADVGTVLDPAVPTTSLVADIREGVNWLRGHRTLRTMATMVGITNFATSAAFPLYVLYAVGDGSTLGLSEPEFGILLVVGAIGGLIGTAGTEWVERWLGTARALTFSILTTAVFLITPALTDRAVVAAAGLLVGSFGMMVWNIPTVSFRQDVVPDRLLGRLNSVYRLLAWGVMPLGAATGGLLGEVLGVRPVFALTTLTIIPMLLLNRRITSEALAADRAASTS